MNTCMKQKVSQSLISKGTQPRTNAMEGFLKGVSISHTGPRAQLRTAPMEETSFPKVSCGEKPEYQAKS